MAEERSGMTLDEYDVHMRKLLALPANIKKACLFLGMLSSYFEMPEHFEDRTSGGDPETLWLIHRIRLTLEPVLKAMPEETTDEICHQLSKLIKQIVAAH